tara:strand:+ start:234 stop:692 length:459 start_codon:yes stop_codon:yes gene_type:complete
MSITNSTTIRSINNTSDDRVRLEGPIVELPTGVVNLTSADSGVIYTLKANSYYELNLPLESVEIGTKITLMNNLNYTLLNVTLEIYADGEGEAVAINLLNVGESPASFIDSNTGVLNATGEIPQFFKVEFIYVGNDVWKSTAIGSDVCLDEL